MRRRRLFTVVRVLTLLLCVAIGASWARSRWRYDVVAFWPRAASDRAVAVLTDSGTFCVATIREQRGGSTDQRLKHYAAPPGRLQRYATIGPFVFDRNFQGGPGDRVLIGAPHWLLLAIPATVLVVSAWRTRSTRRRRAAKGLCLECGYDLRATPERCPECGAVAAATVAG